MTSPGTFKLVRGGSWGSLPRSGVPRACRSARRDNFRPCSTLNCIGFRVVCLPQEVAPPQMVLRGGTWSSGSWDFTPRSCRSAYRNFSGPGNANFLIGFRVVCLPWEVAP